jgi:hypothetical protein
MDQKRHSEKLGLEVWLQHPEQQGRLRISSSRDDLGNVVYPELDESRHHRRQKTLPWRVLYRRSM